MKSLFKFHMIIALAFIAAIMPAESFAQFSNVNVLEKINLDFFCKPLSSVPGYEDYGVSKPLADKLLTMKDDKTIEQALKKMYFNTLNPTERREYDELSGEEYIVKSCTYTHSTPAGRLYIDRENDTYTLKFPDQQTKNDFMKSVTAKGYKIIDNSDGNKLYQIPGNEDAYWVGVNIIENGNNVTLSPNREY